MLTSEQKQALENAKALIQEIEAMEGGEAEGAAPVAPQQEARMAFNPDEQMSEQPEGEETTQPEEKKKLPEVKESVTRKTYKELSTMGNPDASTADDKAEERVDDRPEQDDESIDEVAKALEVLTRAMKKRNVNKSNDSDGLISVIDGLTKVVKSLAADQKEQRSVLNDMLEGLNLARKVENQNTVTKSATRRRPIQVTDQNDVLIEVTKALNRIADQTGGQVSKDDNTHVVRKTLRENLASLLTYNQQ